MRAAESGRTRFLYLAACILALGFLAKQLQAFLVLPAIALAFCFYAQKAWRELRPTASPGVPGSA